MSRMDGGAVIHRLHTTPGLLNGTTVVVLSAIMSFKYEHLAVMAEVVSGMLTTIPLIWRRSSYHHHLEQTRALLMARFLDALSCQ